MKFLILASFVVFATASTVYKSRNIALTDDGSIWVTSPFGKQVIIQQQPGFNGAQVTVTGPNVPTRTFQVGNLMSQGPYGSTLYQIVKEYQGAVNQVQYQNFLNKIYNAVNNGQVSPQLYKLLETIDQVTGPQQYGQGLVQSRYGQRYGQYPSVAFYSQYYGSSRNANPMFQRGFGTGQTLNYISALLANQKMNGRMMSTMNNGLQGYSPRYFGGYQQVPQFYGQQAYAIAQTMQQYQTQKKLNQIEQALEQVQQEQEMEQQIAQAIEQEEQQVMEQFNELQQEQEQTAQEQQQITQQEQQVAQQQQQQYAVQKVLAQKKQAQQQYEYTPMSLRQSARMSPYYYNQQRLTGYGAGQERYYQNTMPQHQFVY